MGGLGGEGICVVSIKGTNQKALSARISMGAKIVAIRHLHANGLAISV
jgi:hypothetical protein